MKTPISRMIFKLKREIFLRCLLKKQNNIPTMRLGGVYGGWDIPTNALTDQSICYLAGAGEDITFDIALSAKYGCHIHIIDPTPRAKDHFIDTIKSLKSSVQSKTGNDEYYPVASNISFDKIHFHPIGLWNKKDIIKFYAPQNENHVSHSALNLQRTTNFFEASVLPVSDLMNQLNHRQLDLLKLDIEGAEYNVIEDILISKIPIKILCIEFDETHTPIDRDFHKRIKKSIHLLQKAGYKIINIDKEFNFTFIYKNHLSDII